MFWIAVGLVITVLLVLLVIKQRSANTSGDLPYKRQPALFTPAERSFLGVLDLAVGNDFRVFGKVRVGDLLAPQNGQTNGQRTTALNKINYKHVDFVLCKPDDLSVVCAIELNDKSHQQKSRQERDEFLRSACRSAGLPLITFDARHAYSPAEVSSAIADALSGQWPKHTELMQQASMPPETLSSMPDSDVLPRCPRCSSAMVKRSAKGGDNAGKEFWGCSNFPKCREIMPV